VQRSGFAQVQDLGRPGYAGIGVAENGAGDQGSARLANALVGNSDDAALIEVIASTMEFRVEADLLIAVSGAVPQVRINGVSWPTHQPLAVPAGTAVTIPEPVGGSRAYLAINGVLTASRVLGSVAPDPLLGFGRRLTAGDTVDLTTDFHIAAVHPLPMFRLPSAPLRYGSNVTLTATTGPDLHRLKGGHAALAPAFTVTPQSDYIGVRLTGGDLQLVVRDEILSRGVPVGAVEVPPSGELIMLLRGRLVTAGYPVVAVLTRLAVDRLAQTRPGDSVLLQLVDAVAAQRAIEAAEVAHRDTAAHLARALRARGLGNLLAQRHASMA
jgi:biotin-dependent carboxylase-like uncharacterized protein